MRVDAEVARHVRLERVSAPLDSRNGRAVSREGRRRAGRNVDSTGIC